MRIETKLGLGSGVMVLAMLLSSAAAYVRIAEANKLSASVLDVHIPASAEAHKIRHDALNSLMMEQSLMLFGVDPASAAMYHKMRLDSWRAAESDYDRLLALNAQHDLGAAAGPIRDIKSSMDKLSDMQGKVETLMADRTSDSTSQAYDMMRGPMASQVADLERQVDNVMDIEGNVTQHQVADLKRANRQMLLTLGLATLFGAISGFGISMMMARRISRGIRLVAERANSIATGDLTGGALDSRASDEIGVLASAMDQMQANLRDILGTVATTASMLTHNAVSMDSASEQIHGRMDQQSQQTEQAAAAMQEMSATIAEVSRHAHDAAETARSAAETAREGGGIVQQMLSSMNSIASAVNETSTTIGLLGEDSTKISHIVSVIEEIAQKTNLLALNAAIEAARAGEQGRGFAVVAGEVRRLAESTGHATSEISQMIQGIQERTRTAIAGMHGGTQTVELGMATTNRAGQALQRIIGMAERVDRMIAQIAIAASQQAAASDQSSGSLNSIHSLSNENLAAMGTTAAGIESLRTTAASLEQQIDRFRIASGVVPVWRETQPLLGSIAPVPTAAWLRGTT